MAKLYNKQWGIITKKFNEYFKENAKIDEIRTRSIMATARANLKKHWRYNENKNNDELNVIKVGKYSIIRHSML